MELKKTRILKVCYRSEARQSRNCRAGTRYITVSFISLKGKWLKDFGFDVNTPIKVECEEGKLIITKAATEASI